MSKAGRKSKRKGKPSQPVAPPAPMFDTILTECAQEYGQLQAWPYVRNHSACVPTMPAFPSKKETFRFNATAYANNDGVVFGVINPGHAVVGDTNAAGYLSIAGQSGTVVSTDTSKALRVYTDSPHSPSAFAPDKQQFRLVAAGVRVAYVGAAKETAGAITLLETPDHVSLTGFSRTQFNQYSDAGTAPVTKGNWFHAEWHPVSAEELQYVNAPTSKYSSEAVGFIAEGVSPGEAFEVEAYFHFELLGRATTGRTPSHTDPSGMAASIAVNSSPAGRKPGVLNARGDQSKSVATKIFNRLGAMAHYVVTGISGVSRAMKIDTKGLQRKALSFASNALGKSANFALAAAPLALAMI